MEQHGTPNTWSSPYTDSGVRYQPAPQQPTPPKRRQRPVVSHALVAIVALFIGVGIGSAGHSADASSTQAGSATTTQPTAPATYPAASTTSSKTTPARTTAAAAAPAKSAPSVPTRVSGDGEYLVGVDMQAGTYRTAGPQDDSLGLCYWERDKNASGDFSAIIANNALSGSGIVTVKRGEYFKSTGCQGWVHVG